MRARRAAETEAHLTVKNQRQKVIAGAAKRELSTGRIGVKAHQAQIPKRAHKNGPSE